MAEAFKNTAVAMELLDRFGGMPTVNRNTLADILVALGNLGPAHPRIPEIDINPLLVGSSGMAAADVTIVLG